MICVGHVTLYRGLAWPKWGKRGFSGNRTRGRGNFNSNIHIDCWIHLCRAGCTMGKCMYFTDYSFPFLPVTHPSSIPQPPLVHFLF